LLKYYNAKYWYELCGILVMAFVIFFLVITRFSVMSRFIMLCIDWCGMALYVVYVVIACWLLFVHDHTAHNQERQAETHNINTRGETK
jgi:hypothetical protein